MFFFGDIIHVFVIFLAFFAGIGVGWKARKWFV